jgi:mycothiol system anti-sigma-R factor
VSCGHPHETPCVEVLALVYTFIDGECTDTDRARVVQHLDECPPCLQQFGLEQAVKTLVHRSCSCTAAPDELRVQIVTRIRQISITYRTTGD